MQTENNRIALALANVTFLIGLGVTPAFAHAQLRREKQMLRRTRHVRSGSWLFSNSGPEVKLSVNILAGFRVLSAVGARPPHDGVR